jgi:UDP-N-acetylglucosamine/UDP-N-acetylgalactosamine diphosphorylase
MSQLFGIEIEDRLTHLASKGVIIPDVRQVFIGPEVDLENIQPGTKLFPGVRILGKDSVLGRNAIVGSEGPATLDNVALDDQAEIASGYVTNTVLLREARIGSNGHVRACTLLEEEASTAHAVGLKQSVLMSFATLGSLINFCDAIVAGGTSRSNHTEIGSGSINFNFTPWGERGDKATPTLLGNVYDGALLDNDRIFLGGLSGVIGPAQISFGAVTVAGQIIRHDVKPNTLLSTVPRKTEGPVNVRSRVFSERKYQHNLNFISNLFALREWYSQVRLPRSPDVQSLSYKKSIVSFAIKLIDQMISERLTRLSEYLRAYDRTAPTPNVISLPCPIELDQGSNVDHIEWVRLLDDGAKRELKKWLKHVGKSIWQT